MTAPNPLFTYQSNDTVFYYNRVYARFFPLYMFNAARGDTLTLHSPDIPRLAADTIWRAVVDSITTFRIGSTTLKRFWIHETPGSRYSFWGTGYTELLGSRNLMLPQPRIIIPESDGPLRCYSDSTISGSFFSLPCDYRLTNGVNEVNSTQTFRVFPNPATNTLNIQSERALQGSFNIYNVVGQLLQSGTLTADMTTIALPRLADGIYRLDIWSGGVRQSRSFVVQQ